jgi:hypothetical protein
MVDDALQRHISTEGEETSHSLRYIGLSLVGGFCVMFLVDRIGHSHHSTPLPSSPDEVLNIVDTKWSTTIGLLVHSAADGIAMGAASSMDGINSRKVNQCLTF